MILMPILSPTDCHWILETQQSAYCFHLHETGLLVHDYFGPRLPYATDYPRTLALTAWSSFNDAAHQLALEYPGYAGLNYTEPCLKATFSDGVRDLRQSGLIKVRSGVTTLEEIIAATND